MDLEETITTAEQELSKLDPKLGLLIEQQGTIIHQPRTNYFASLCRSIVGQQVSVKAATTIFARFEAETQLLPIKVAKLDDRQVKTIGLSRQKAGYLRDLGQHFTDDPKVYNHLDQLSDQEVIEDLTAVKGIGVWTAQMFLMFSLVRLDVFAPLDRGLQLAMQQLYGWKVIPGPKELEAIAEKWRPYRSVASWHLWKSLNNSPS